MPQYKLARITLERLYFAFIRSILEYASVVWESCCKGLPDKIQRVNYRAAKIISGAITHSSQDMVLQRTGLGESLRNGERTKRLKVLHKVVNNVAPTYLQHEIPHTTKETRYTLWNSNRIPATRGRTVAYDSISDEDNSGLEQFA